MNFDAIFLRGKSMTDPFENECGTYHVITNTEGQNSLWPSFIEVPQGWISVHRSKTRADCVEFVNQNWTDMRPKSLTLADPA